MGILGGTALEGRLLCIFKESRHAEGISFRRMVRLETTPGGEVECNGHATPDGRHSSRGFGSGLLENIQTVHDH